MVHLVVCFENLLVVCFRCSLSAEIILPYHSEEVQKFSNFECSRGDFSLCWFFGKIMMEKRQGGMLPRHHCCSPNGGLLSIQFPPVHDASVKQMSSSHYSFQNSSRVVMALDGHFVMQVVVVESIWREAMERCWGLRS